MKIEQIYTGCLAQGAYYIESEGEAAVIDPLREVAPYIEKAKADITSARGMFDPLLSAKLSNKTFDGTEYYNLFQPHCNQKAGCCCKISIRLQIRHHLSSILLCIFHLQYLIQLIQKV